MKYKSFYLIDKIIDSLKKQFPKKCSCGKEFKDFKEFIENTSLPAPQNLQIFDCDDVHEVLSLRNCNNCNSTIAIRCALDDIDKKVLLDLIKEDIKINNIEEDEFLQILRNEVLSCAKKKLNINNENSQK
ncbi:hypothetical protein DEFDS_1221 [Deferribacter desulfuricans SSM1]|uniref:Uncharacterized protein n=1 Tax=Deferribacter desulfuricans (strain DSM 14783 / JCM 11476 / NBRC 101012 / SSM1) TaxID=639282 RepID=D3PDL6_DEFDS|nr:hypothetical protein [Deferribacter desulfuricans]BAI80689.1 hypothetical protein DEFDS_1221 [Deferribacter desulfuricans SSM1]